MDNSAYQNRPESISIAEYISEIPDGINNFENWLNNDLLDFAKTTFKFSNQTLKENIHFARLLDNRDYESFIATSKSADKNIEDWKLLLEPIFNISDVPYLPQAFACINLGLDNAAISLLHQWIQNAWFKDESIRKILDEAKALVAVKNFQSDAGIKWRKN